MAEGISRLATEDHRYSIIRTAAHLAPLLTFGSILCHSTIVPSSPYRSQVARPACCLQSTNQTTNQILAVWSVFGWFPAAAACFNHHPVNDSTASSDERSVDASKRPSRCTLGPHKPREKRGTKQDPLQPFATTALPLTFAGHRTVAVET